MNTKRTKVLWLMGSIALAVVAFHFVPKLQKRLEDELYQKMK